MAEQIKISAKSSYLKDRTGNIILPYTKTAFVFTDDNRNLSDVLTDIVTKNQYSELTTKLNDIMSEVDSFRYDIGSTSNYYLLKEENNKATGYINSLTKLRNELDVLDRIDNEIKSVNYNISQLSDKVEVHDMFISNQESVNTSINEKIDTINDKLNILEQNTLHSIDLENDNKEIINTVLNVEQNIDLSELSLKCIIELYELTNTDVATPSIVEAYRYFYNKGEIKIKDMPIPIQDIILTNF